MNVINEPVNETLDEQYSRNLAYNVTEGFSEKAAKIGGEPDLKSALADSDSRYPFYP